MDRDARRGLLLISPTALYAVGLLALPLLAVLAISFATQDFVTIDWSPSLANYREALSDPIYRELLLRSVRVAFLVTLVTVVLSFPVAYFISFHVRPGRKALWLFLITLPFWTSYLVRIFLWKVILGFNGVVNSSLIGLGLIDAPLSFILYNSTAVVVTLAHAFAPFAILPMFVALERIDRSLLEAARDLGESHITAFCRVTLPLAMPGISAAVLIVFIPTIGDYVTPRLVGGPDGLMMANMIQTQFLRLNNAPLGAALSVLSMVCVGALALVFGLWARRFGARQ